MFSSIRNFLFILGEKFIYSPNFLIKFLAFLLFPFSVIFALIQICRAKILSKNLFKFDFPIISIGNLSLGGSGKTPVCIELLNLFSGGAVVLRGYGRKSKGLLVIYDGKNILTNVEQSGDEAMLYAINLRSAIVIVSEDRICGIKKARQMGAKYVILDDGFGKFNIDKFNILIRPKNPPALPFCLPCGGYRYPIGFYKYADLIIQNGIDFYQQSSIKNQTKRMVLVSAIANPNRLSNFIKYCVGFKFFADHHSFTKIELKEILKKYDATSLLITQKDYVKVMDFGLNLSIIELKTTISQEFYLKIKSLIENNL